jgi:hypothetical protein
LNIKPSRRPSSIKRQQIVKVKIKDERKPLEATPEHPFYVKTMHPPPPEFKASLFCLVKYFNGYQGLHR